MIDYASAGCSSGCEPYTHTDERGSVVATSDASGDMTDVFTYSSYGESGAEGDSGFPFRFTGQKVIASVGLYYYKARFYDPEAGRFLQADPIGYGDGMNLYAYVGGDPINAVDPTGLDTAGIDTVVVKGIKTRYQLVFTGPGGRDSSGNTTQQDIAAMDAYECGVQAFLDTDAETAALLAASAHLKKQGVRKLLTGFAWPLAIGQLLQTGVRNDPHVPIYRAVGSSELADIYSSTPAQFRMSPSGFGEKQFFTTLSDAQWFANSTASWPGAATAIVQTHVRPSTFQLGHEFLDAGHPAVSFDAVGLTNVNNDAAKTGIQTVETCP